MSNNNRENPLFLFDLDGTLAVSRHVVDESVATRLRRLREKGKVGIVSGSQAEQILYQLGGDSAIGDLADTLCGENGAVVMEGSRDNIKKRENMRSFLGEPVYEELVSKAVKWMQEANVPFRTSSFVEHRNGLVNFCPVGRDCSFAQRQEFGLWEEKNPIRKEMASYLKQEYGKKGLVFAMGGQISVDCYPVGWDKTRCLEEFEGYFPIYFFGDRIFEGGNDFEIGTHPRVTDFKVNSPEHLVEILDAKFFDNSF
eukprot:GHVP01032022.1.p1 GENE.GHVP01032022.1~~GHVP01032022.1.p1  ORF type:complete len:255 (+),score=44.02 GHVP01032022.1:2702-3466(+)